MRRRDFDMRLQNDRHGRVNRSGRQLRRRRSPRNLYDAHVGKLFFGLRMGARPIPIDGEDQMEQERDRERGEEDSAVCDYWFGSKVTLNR